MSPENLSRRTILAGAATAPVVTLPTAPAAAAPAVDDTLARIERHRICNAKFDEIVDRESELGSVIPADRRKRISISDKYKRPRERRPALEVSSD